MTLFYFLDINRIQKSYTLIYRRMEAEQIERRAGSLRTWPTVPTTPNKFQCLFGAFNSDVCFEAGFLPNNVTEKEEGRVRFSWHLLTCLLWESTSLTKRSRSSLTPATERNMWNKLQGTLSSVTLSHTLPTRNTQIHRSLARISNSMSALQGTICTCDHYNTYLRNNPAPRSRSPLIHTGRQMCMIPKHVILIVKSLLTVGVDDDQLVLDSVVGFGTSDSLEE